MTTLQQPAGPRAKVQLRVRYHMVNTESARDSELADYGYLTDADGSELSGRRVGGLVRHARTALLAVVLFTACAHTRGNAGMVSEDAGRLMAQRQPAQASTDLPPSEPTHVIDKEAKNLSVEWVRPSHSNVLTGAVTIRLRTRGPCAVRLVELRLGGQSKKLTAPPWVFEFDLGDRQETDLTVLTEDECGHFSDGHMFTID